MELGLAAKSLFNGDFQESFNYLFVPAGEVAKAQETTDALTKITQQEEVKGIITPEEGQRRINAIAMSSDYKALFAIPEYSPVAGFTDSLQKSQADIKSALGGGVNAIFGTIPWQIYALLGVAIFIYLLPLFIARRTV